MIWKSIWHIESTGLIAQVVFVIIMAILGSLGVYFSSPMASALAGFVLFLLIYRLRYKRL